MHNFIFSSKEFEESFTYTKNDLGVNYTKTATTFKLWAPTCENAKVLIYKSYDSLFPSNTVDMQKSENGTWEITILGNLKNYFYTFSVTLDFEESEAVDPYARAVSLNGIRGAIVDPAETNPFEWEYDERPYPIKPEDSVIYEASIRDMTISPNSGVLHKGLFLGLTESNTFGTNNTPTGLSHLIELGITHIHFLPVLDFEGIDELKPFDEYNWGYNPLHFNVPEGSYSTDPKNPITRIKELKTLIQTMHKNNIRVILDMVYNHTFRTEDSNFNKLVPDYYYRKNSDNSFSNGSGCGNELASERSMVRKFIIDSVLYWANEYHIDGFRFDLMGLIDIDTMNIIRHELDKIDKNILIYGEGWVGGYSPLPDSKRSTRMNATNPKLDRIAMFNDEIRDAIKGSVFSPHERGFATGNFIRKDSILLSIAGSVGHPQLSHISPRVNQPTQIINYVSSHDNHTLWDKICISNFDYSENDKIKMDKLCQAIVLTSQGIPFIQSGEEFLRTKNGNSNSYNSGDIDNRIDWERKSKYWDVFNYYKMLIQFRKNHPALRMTSKEDIQKNLTFLDLSSFDGTIAFSLNNYANGDSFNTILVIFNANNHQSNVVLPRGKWSIIFDDEIARTQNLSITKPLHSCDLTIDPISAIILADVESIIKKESIENV